MTYNYPNPAITIASIDCTCHCEVVSTVAISSEKARLIHFIRNDNSYRWIWELIDIFRSIEVSCPSCPQVPHLRPVGTGSSGHPVSFAFWIPWSSQGMTDYEEKHEAKAGIQKKYWIPGQARNDRLIFHVAILIAALVLVFPKR